jgi:hypothetical protein
VGGAGAAIADPRDLTSERLLPQAPLGAFFFPLLTLVDRR